MNYLISKEYVAGFFDGEGFILISRHLPYKKYKQKNIVYYFRLGIENTDLNVLKEIQKRYGGNIYTRPNQRSLNRKITHQWYLNGNKALKFLLDIKNFLIVKKQQTKLAIEYQQTQNKYWGRNPNYRNQGLTKDILNYRENICQKIRKLNSNSSTRKELWLK